MVSGNVRAVKDAGQNILLTVRGTGCEHYDECDVLVKKDGQRTEWFANAMGKTGIKVWWQSNILFATFGDIGDYKFEKVSTTRNNKTV